MDCYEKAFGQKLNRNKTSLFFSKATPPNILDQIKTALVMHTKELDMLIIQVEMELNLHKTHCHFLVAQLQDLEPNVSRKH